MEPSLHKLAVWKVLDIPKTIHLTSFASGEYKFQMATKFTLNFQDLTLKLTRAAVLITWSSMMARLLLHPSFEKSVEMSNLQSFLLLTVHRMY